MRRALAGVAKSGKPVKRQIITPHTKFSRGG
jgi:hypothetical protein